MPTKKEKCLGHTTQNAVGAVRTRYCDGRCNSQSESIEWETEFLKNNCGCEAAFKDRGMVDPGCFGHRVIESGIIEQAITTAVAKEKQSIWKEVFEKGYEFSGQDLKEAVKARDKELVEDVEKMKVWPPEIFDRKDLSGQREKGFNEAIDKILSILKH